MKTLTQARQLQDRTKKFAVRIVKAFARLPKNEATRVIGCQFLRSGTSLAANYRSACRARSAADFISKVSVVTEEADAFLFRVVDRIRANQDKIGSAADVGVHRVIEDIFGVARYGEDKSVNP